jgi:hypothetical protein
VSYLAKHSPPTKRFEAWIDSGSPDTYFHASVGRAIGIKVETGPKISLGGIVHTGSAGAPVFFHEVGLHVGADIIKIKAGFCDKLAVAGILGRRGFFENFVVTFDPAAAPPGFEIQRMIVT